MRKLLFGAVALLLMASCAGNGGSEKAGTDSSQTTDSPVQTEVAAQAEADQARQDSITKAEKAAQYDELLNQYIKSVNNPNYKNANKSWELGNKLEKIKDKLTPEQRAKYKKAKSKRQRNYAA